MNKSEDYFLHMLDKTKKIEDTVFKDMVLDGFVIENKNLSWASFENMSFRNAVFKDCILDSCKFKNVDFAGAKFKNVSLKSADLVGSNLTDVVAENVNFYSANLNEANLTGIQVDETSQYFRNLCPEGYFLGYKCCLNYRIVKLLIPKDAKRCSATGDECRCEKAKVLEIANIERTKFYKEATSFVDDEFVYRLGELIYADNYNDNRWLESSGGIHFYLSRERATRYM